MKNKIPVTLMEQEAKEAPEVIARQIRENKDIISSLCRRLRKHRPPFAMTVARGSSDHAATYAKYLLETRMGMVTSGAAPSVLTLYGTQLYEKGGLVIGISQSGKSPDICEMMESARKRGAVTISIVNHEESPLAKAAEYVIPLRAGEEKAVAATKSYLGSLSALLQLGAEFLQDRELLGCLDRLPEFLQQALEKDWSGAVDALKGISDTLVIGRGYGYPIAQEAALKFKETASVHAEAFSGAEVLHGPFALVKKDYPVLLFMQGDSSLPGMIDLGKEIKALGAFPLVAAPAGLISEEEIKKTAEVYLPLPEALSPLCDPLMAIQAFYPMVARFAVSRGYNPDSPEHLKKITETI